MIDCELAHKDSTGTSAVIRPGDVQRISAETGVRRSEFNSSATAPVHFLQIWVLPEKNGLAPSYEQKSFSRQNKAARLKLVGSRDGRDGSVTIHQDLEGEPLSAGAGRGRVHSAARVSGFTVCSVLCIHLR